MFHQSLLHVKMGFFYSIVSSLLFASKVHVDLCVFVTGSCRFKSCVIMFESLLFDML